MSKKRISMADIVIGQPLAWNVYDENHNLLLRRNFVIRDEQQIDALVRRGLFSEGNAAASEEANKQIAEQPSTLRLINQANKNLGRLLYNISNEADFEAKILAVVSLIKTAVKINDNIALATIMLNRSASAYAVRHCIDTAIVALLIARSLKMGEEDIEIVLAAALTMNIGMLRHQEQLQAKAEELTSEEKEVIKNHPQFGMLLLKQAGVENIDWLTHVLKHHETENGNGYPFGKAGAKIPLGTKIISIADRYCAQVSPRTYRQALLPNAALRTILLDEKQNFDQIFVGTIMHVLGAYPPGTFVKLENGETGVVTRRGQTTTTPIVHSLIGPRDAPLAFPIQRDTAQPLHAVREIVLDTKAAVRVSMQQLWGSEASF